MLRSTIIIIDNDKFVKGVTQNINFQLLFIMLEYYEFVKFKIRNKKKNRQLLV